MDLTRYLDALQADLAAAAAPGGPETTRAAELLGHALAASARLALLEALSDAAAEITTRLPDASVEVRLRGRDADLVVTAAGPAAPMPGGFPPGGFAPGGLPPGGFAPGGSPPGGLPPGGPVPVPDGGDVARLTLRMPEALKAHVEQSAAAEGLSVNAWLVRAVTTAVRGAPGPARTGRRLTGFFQA